MKFRILSAALLAIIAGASAAQTPATASGKVTKVDAAAGKITIDHGPIKALDMPAMTMVFKAGNEAMLKAVKAGDRVTFVADRVNGQITLVRIEKAK